MRNANKNTSPQANLQPSDTATTPPPDAWLRTTALIFFFNGLFSFLRTIFSLIGNDFFLDPRIVNIFIALGLVTKKRVWYIMAIISAGSDLFWHSFRIIESAASSLWIVLYFLLAISIDVFQLYALLRKKTRTNYLTTKDKQ